jgi:hypothetical protein
MTTINLQITLDSLVSAIQHLSLEEKREFLEILEQQVFEAEEDKYKDDSATISELEAVRSEYANGEFANFDSFLGSLSDKIS